MEYYWVNICMDSGRMESFYADKMGKKMIENAFEQEAKVTLMFPNGPHAVNFRKVEAIAYLYRERELAECVENQLKNFHFSPNSCVN